MTKTRKKYKAVSPKRMANTDTATDHTPKEFTVRVADVNQGEWLVSGVNHPVVMVRWEDAMHMRGEVEDSEVRSVFKDPVLESVGFLVEDAKTHVTIAQEWHEGEKSWRFLMRIPRSMVRKVVRLGESQG